MRATSFSFVFVHLTHCVSIMTERKKNQLVTQKPQGRIQTDNTEYERDRNKKSATLLLYPRTAAAMSWLSHAVPPALQACEYVRFHFNGTFLRVHTPVAHGLDSSLPWRPKSDCRPVLPHSLRSQHVSVMRHRLFLQKKKTRVFQTTDAGSPTEICTPQVAQISPPMRKLKRQSQRH